MARRNTNTGPQNPAQRYTNENNNLTLGGDAANEHANQALSRTGDAINRHLNPEAYPREDRVPTFGHGVGSGLAGPPVNPGLPDSGLDPASSEMKVNDQRNSPSHPAATTTQQSGGSGLDPVSSPIRNENQRND